MDIRGKQSDALHKFYNVVIKYHELRKKLSASELARKIVSVKCAIKMREKLDDQ